ncbi:hypothetical protein [Saccharopolyspora sp. 6V]|uniref:hypothetical protein n=1 Tax=Saccharopolyspora sp. 6V TaxID=2877239 RepID=UPI001CD73287|nr:hypothetical protein [Saccharopolyspora sp. 6V]MCA1194901.1 hypothetical protein [Saccharopolyspora sp. 6V]
MYHWWMEQSLLGLRLAAVLLLLNLFGLHSCAVWVSDETDMRKLIRRRVRNFSEVVICLLLWVYICLNYSHAWQLPLRDLIQVLALFTVFVCMLYRDLLWGTISRAASGSITINGWSHWFDGNSFSKFQTCLVVAFVRSRMRLVTFVSGAGLLFALGFRSLNSDSHPQGLDRWASVVGDSLPYFFGVLFLWVYVRLMRFMRPSNTLLEKCFGSLFASAGDAIDGRHGGGAASWRSRKHREMFEAAKSVELCVPGLRRILSKADFEFTSSVYVGLAESIREEAIRCSDQNRSPRAELLLLMASTLVLNDNPVLVARRINRMVKANQSEDFVGSRLRKLLPSLNDIVGRYAKLIVAAGILVVALLYAAMGQFSDLFKFAQALVGG